MEEEQRERLDVLMVKRGLCASREKAKTCIKDGIVYVNGKKEEKPGTFLTEKAVIELRGEVMKFVSRGGYKLEKACRVFGLDLRQKSCMDVGASTGGFTDCMLQNGAKSVVAVDVGKKQLAQKLLDDPRVISREECNIRYVTPDFLEEPVDFVSIDVSFISLTKVLLPIKGLMKDGARMVCLVKPQFEAGKGNVGKNGVVKDKAVHKKVLGSVISYADDIGMIPLGIDYSPIRGPEGNIEYLLYLEKSPLASLGLADSLSVRAEQVVNGAHKEL